MTTVTAREIPPGSYTLRVFHGDDIPDEADIETVLILRNHGDGVCEAAAAHGDLYPGSLVAIGLKAYELGFRTIEFHALKHVKVTHWADFVKEDEHFRYYTVDLDAAIARYLTERAL